MGVHKYVDERCVFCGIGTLQIFTDREDVENALRCLGKQARVMDTWGAQDWEDIPENPV